MARDIIMARVFLSYCREDIAEVSRLRRQLMTEGFDVWWDKDLLPGQDWKYEIREAMKRSSAVILCLSARGLQRSRSYIYPEALDAITAYRQRRPGEVFIIPVRFTQCEIPSIEIDDTRTLDRLHCVDLFPTNLWESGIRKIVMSISPGAPSAPPIPDPDKPPEHQHHRRVKHRHGREDRHVFLSYSSHDKAVGDEMCAALEKDGIRCWIAQRDIEPGKRYAAQIVDAIVGSRAFVLIFSSNSNNSKHVIREVDKAVREGITIIPFRIENVAPTKDMDYLISISQWIDACTPPLAEHFNTLARTLQTMGDEPPIRPATPPPRPRTHRLMFVGVCLSVASLSLLSLAFVLWRWSERAPAERAKDLIAAVPIADTKQLQTSDGSEKTSVAPSQKEDRPSTKNDSQPQASPPTVQPAITTGPKPIAPPTPRESTVVTDESTALDHLEQGTKLLEKKSLELALPKLLLAIELLKSVDEGHPKLPQAFKLVGDLYYQKREYSEAIKAYTEAVEREDSGMRRHARGLVYCQRGQYDMALTDFSQAIRLDDGKDRADFHLDRANLLARAKRFAEANAGYDRATRLDPRSAQAFDAWGRSFASAGDVKEAIKKFTEAIKLDPRADFYFDRGCAYCALGISNPYLGEYGKAIEDYTEAIQRGRKDAETFVRRGDAYGWINYRLAIRDYTEAIQLVQIQLAQKGVRSLAGDEYKKQAYLGRGRLYLKLAQPEKALEDANLAASVDPQDPKVKELHRYASYAIREATR
jgi:tetratricopeptide (TPR) repeat protein